METNLQKRVVQGIADIFRPLLKVAPDSVLTVDFLHTLGWDIQALLDGDLTPLTTVLTAVEQQVGQVEQLVGSANAPGIGSFSALRTALQATKGLGQALQQLTALNLAGNLANTFYLDVLQKLVTIYLLTQQGRLYQFFTVTGIIVPEVTTIQLNGRYVKYVSQVPLFSFDRLLEFLKSPKQRVAAEYWPNGIADFATTNSTSIVAQKLLPRLTNFLTSLGLPATVANAHMPGIALSIEETEALKSAITLSKFLPLPGQGALQLGAYVGLLSAQNEGPGVFITPYGAADFENYLGEWLVQLQLASNIGTLVLKQDSVTLLGNSLSPEGNIRLLISKRGDNALGVGNQGGTSLQLGAVQAGIGLAFTATSHVIDVYASLANSTLTIHPDEGDSFLNKVVPTSGLNVKFNALLGWSSAKGLYFGGQVGLKNTIPVTSARAEKILKITSLTTELVLTDRLAVHASASGEVTLGPLTVSVGEIGLAVDLAAAPNGGNAGPFDVSLGFKGPSSIGITVNSDTLTGGGYLFFDPAHHQYAGVANLKLKTATQEINLTALGLLQTELPGNPDAYSLLLLITATFNPIQLGLGFTLNGIGGLLGVNRATDTDYLRGLVRGGHLDQLLFPANVLDNPAAALALVDAAFPATEGRYVIGLLARLGWGTPTSLITLDVALLIELPSPVRLAILGVLEATLPSKDKDLLKLRADFLGTVDFGSKRAAFDATLSDSHLLAFALTGDLAFRFYQGNNPLFVITAGGFHPAFQPPAGANLTRLNRLTLALSRGNDLRVTLTSYFAVTSNTVQFGSHLELYYRIARGLHVQGYFGFDVLFQFNPFHVQAHVEAGVAIRYGSRELLSLHLSLDVTGPGPWHIWGSASFKVWFVRIHVNVDATIGGGSTEPALPATDVKTLLVTALNAAASWEVEAPKTALPGGVVLRPVGTTAATFFLDPRGSLLLRQRVVPLGVQLGKYGRGPITLNSGQRFDLTELVVAGVHHPVATDKDVEVVRDFFAPDQFQQLTDAQKLSLPSFQLLPCGLRLASMAGLVADDKATLRVVEYEHKLLDGTSGGAITSRPPKMSARGYQQLVRGGALGQEIDTACPSARAPQPVNWAEDAFVVVHAATLEVYDSLNHARFATQVEAEQYRQELVATTPSLSGEVLVVPAYQLELT